MTYDQKCHDLAVHFLTDQREPCGPEVADLLACAIQQAVEDFLNEFETERGHP